MRIRSIPFFFLLLLISCNAQEVCDGNTQSEMVARLKTIKKEVVYDTIIPGVSLFGLREGRPDSLLYNSITTSRIVIPLDPHHGFSRFVLNINEQSDTLRINHKTEFYMLSYTCGFGALFTIDSFNYSNSMIRDIEIINPVVYAELEQNEEHLWIYF